MHVNIHVTKYHWCFQSKLFFPKVNFKGYLTNNISTSGPSPVNVPSPCSERSARGSVSNENNILLDPDVLTDYPTQALLLTVLVSS